MSDTIRLRALLFDRYWPSAWKRGNGPEPPTASAVIYERAKSGPAARPDEKAMLEAAIQLDLITPGEAERLVESGTASEWLMEQRKKKVERIEPRKLLDRLALIALLLFNIAALVAIGWGLLWALRSL